ncbi:MAG: type II secretion system F family protein [Flavobacteriales bacterium]
MPIPTPPLRHAEQQRPSAAAVWLAIQRRFAEVVDGLPLARALGDKPKQQFYQELHMLIASGVDPATVLDLLGRTRKDERSKRLFAGLRRSLAQGRTLSGAFQETGSFAPYEVQTIQVGEETGRLPNVLGELAEHFAAKVKLKRTLMGAFAYPSFVLFVTCAVVVFMLRVVVPMFSDVFSRSGAELPAITQFMVRMSHWSGPILLGLFIVIGAAIGAFALFRSRPPVQRFTAWISVRLPLVGPIYKQAQFARCYRALGSMLGAQLPLDRALALGSELVGLHSLRHALVDIRDRVLKGGALHEACAAHPLFDAKDVAMIAVAEEVRQLDVMFMKMAEQHTAEVQHRTGLMGSVLEPVMIVFIAVFVGLILVAMYLPMFKLSTAF